MSSNFLKPKQGGLRQPTDSAKENGDIINPPRYAALGGLTGPSKIAPTVNGTSNSNNLRLSKVGK